jgi:hypothetical protein
MDKMETLCSEWITQKNIEDAAKKAKKEIEREILHLGLVKTKQGGTKKTAYKQFQITASTPVKHKVERDLLLSLAKSNNHEEALEIMFKWEPILNKEEWNMAPEQIKNILAPAITTKENGTTFKIEINGEL